MNRNKEKRIDRLVTIGIVVSMVMLTVFPVLMSLVNGQERKKVGEDCAALRSCIAEAYINTYDNPDFVNTAVGDEPMLIPDQYYKHTESALGHGRSYAVVYENHNVDAYFGVPERNLDYYMWGDYELRTDWIVRLLPYIQFVFLVVIIGLSIYRSYRNDLKKTRVINESGEVDPSDRKPMTKRVGGMTVSYSVILLLVSLYMLAWCILQLYPIPGYSTLSEVLSLMSDPPFIIALSGLLDTVITIWEQKGSARWMTLLTGALSGWLMLDVFRYHLGAWSLRSNLIVLPLLVSLCWVIRNVLFRRIEKEDA